MYSKKPLLTTTIDNYDLLCLTKVDEGPVFTTLYVEPEIVHEIK
jgi:hypothetical protein